MQLVSVTDYKEILFSIDIADSVLFEQQGRVFSLDYSNVGDVNRVMNRHNEEVWSHGPFKAQNVFFSAEHKLIGGCFSLAIATFNGNMIFNLGFPVPTYDRALMRSIMESAIAIAKQKCTVSKI